MLLFCCGIKKRNACGHNLREGTDLNARPLFVNKIYHEFPQNAMAVQANFDKDPSVSQARKPASFQA